MADDIIKYSHSPYTNPIVAILKKNGKVRLCLDAREIKKMIVNDRTSSGEILEILKKFHGTKFISTWDTVCGYWQVELHPESRKYMAFIFDGRNYQFKRLPFGPLTQWLFLLNAWIRYWDRKHYNSLQYTSMISWLLHQTGMNIVTELSMYYRKSVKK